MFRRLTKKGGAIVLMMVVLASNPGTEFLMQTAYTYLTVTRHSDANVVDKIYLARKNKNVVDNFGSLGVKHAEAAVASSTLQYHADIGPVNGSVTSGYVFASLFNPGASGRTIVIKRIAVRANNATTASANWVNLSVRRTTAASAGIQITQANIPKKNTESDNSIAEVRHTGVTTTLSGTTESRLLSQTMPGALGGFHSSRDITFAAGDEKLVLLQGQGIALYQEAAGNANHRIRMYIEWEEVASAPAAGGEFLYAFPRVENVAAANYVYNAMFNPIGSGKSAVIRRIWFGTDACDAAAIYTNNIVLRRVTAASAGTQVATTSIPKKNTGSADTAMQFRHTGVTVTATGTTAARLGHVTPCGAAGQASGWQKIDFEEADEELVLQVGEGIALMSDAAGDVDQHVRMTVEWKEVASGSTPASQGEYIWASDKVASTTQANTNLYSFFNPVGSGKTIVIKRLVILVNATTTARYPSYNVRRVTAASGGTLIASTDLPKKHTGTANSIAEARWCLQACTSAITATYVGTAAARLLSTTGPGAVGQIIGRREIVFGANEKLILKNGEGFGVYPDGTTGSAAHSVKIQVEWDEEVSAPTALNEYLIDIGPIAGNTGTSYNYATFLNPSGAATTTVIKRVVVRVDAVAAAVYAPFQLRRLSAASAGTLIATTDITKKNTGSVLPTMQIRTTGVTATYSGTTTDSHIIGVQAPGAVGSAVLPADSGYAEYIFTYDEPIVLRAGEGIGLYHDTIAGDADFRVRLGVEWAEVPSGSTPTAQNEYMITSNWTPGATATTSIYTTFYNPVNSNKYYTVKRIGMRGTRIGTLVAPGYIPVTIARVTSASGPRLTDVNNIPKKNTSSATSTAEISYGVFGAAGSATFSLASTSRMMGLTAPGAVNQKDVFESSIASGDELILKPGEGIAMYQEQGAGDLLLRYRLMIAWQETAITSPYLTFAGFRFFNNSNSLDVGSALAALNTAGSLVSTGAAFRLRALINVATTSLAIGAQNFILQYAGKGGGSCASPSGTPSTYTNITGSTTIAFNANSTAREGLALTTNANDPTDGGRSIIAQIYTTWINFSNSIAAVLVGRDGMWDFSLKDNGATPGATYCIRVAKTSTTLQVWGWNDWAQLGLGGVGTTTSALRTVTRSGTGTTWKKVVGTFQSSLGIRSDGTLWAWGDNQAGILGQGYASTTFPSTVPLQVGSSTNWVTLFGSKSGQHAAAIDLNGRLWMWGQNNNGQLAQSTTTFPGAVSSPLQVGSLTTWKELALTLNSTVALKTDGTLWAWGSDASGELAQGISVGGTTTPIQIGAGTTWTTVVGGNSFFLALKSDGTLWGWGTNSGGQIGQGATSTFINTVTQIGSATNWVEVGAGATWSLGRKSDGTIWAWGDNSAGQSGNGVASTTQPTVVPTQIGSGADWVKIGAGGGFGAAIKSNGTLWLWGGNNQGQQEQNAPLNTSVLVPTQIGSATNWTDVVLGFRHVLAFQDTTSALDAYSYYPEVTTFSAGSQSISFNLSTTTIYFGSLTSGSTRYASSTNVLGSATEVEAHTLAVNTNAVSGYTVTVKGQTLTSAQNSANTINFIGNTNTAPNTSIEQFGIRATASGGSGTVTAPYAASGFAYDATATTSSQIASASTGDSATTTYSIRYMTNISPTTEAGTYNANLVYVVTANF